VNARPHGNHALTKNFFPLRSPQPAFPDMVTATIAIDTTDDEQPYGTATAARSAHLFPAPTRPRRVRNRLASGPRRVVSPDGGAGGGRAPSSSSGGFVPPRKNFRPGPPTAPGVASRDPLSFSGMLEQSALAVVPQAAAVESLGPSHAHYAEGWRSQERQQQQQEYRPGPQRSDPPSLVPAHSLSYSETSAASVALREEEVETEPHQQLPPSMPTAATITPGSHTIPPTSPASKPQKKRQKDPDKPFFNSMETVRVRVLYAAEEQESQRAPEDGFAEFEVTTQDVFRREREMARAAVSYKVGEGRWGGSRIMSGMRDILARRKEAYAHSSVLTPVGENSDVEGEGIGVELPGRAEWFNMMEAHPFVLTFRPVEEEANWDARLLVPRLAEYMSTGHLRVPKESTGNDVLLLLEYFAIVYNPARLSFDGYGSFLRLKLWSDYYSRRTDVANWVVQTIEGATGRASMGFWFATCPAEMRVGDGHHLLCRGRKCEVLEDGKGGSDAVHNFFNDDDPEEETALVSQLRSDFARYVQLFLPGTTVTFTAQQVTLSGAPSPETMLTSVLHVNFSEGGTSKIPRCLKKSMSLASHMSVVEFNAPVQNVVANMESDAVTVITWTGGQSVAENAFDIEREYEERGRTPLGLTEEPQGVEGRPPARSEIQEGPPGVQGPQYVPVVSPEKASHDSPEGAHVRGVSPEQSKNSLSVEGGAAASARSGRSNNAATEFEKLRVPGQSGEPQGGVSPASNNVLCTAHGEASSAVNTDQNVEKNEQNSAFQLGEESLYDRVYKSFFRRTEEDLSDASTVNSNAASPPGGSIPGETLRELSEEQTLEEMNSLWLKSFLGFK